MNPDNLIYKIGIALLPGIGPINAKKLVVATGHAEAVFKENKNVLLKIPGINKSMLRKIKPAEILKQAEKEAEFIQKFNIHASYFFDPEYPDRLKQCEDAPILLFQKGDCNLNNQQIISLVGTRKATQRGREICEILIEDLGRHHPEVIIVSGLAHGIDGASHKSALKNNLQTVAVLGHGFKTIYPAAHRDLAREIARNGALITEFLHNDLPEKGNFVKRNRIIAGLADATIVVESGVRGGALITADLANSYNRDVFAFPGRITDVWSKGCNRLIATNKAALIESIQDLEYIMGWKRNDSKVIQKELFDVLDGDEQKIAGLLETDGELTIDQLSQKLSFSISQTSALLLNLEFKGLVKSLPGKIYRIII